MKLISYNYEDQSGWGIVFGSGSNATFVDGVPSTSGRYLTLLDVLKADALTQIAALSPVPGMSRPLSDVQLCSPITDPQKIICVGFNYRDHATEVAANIPQYPNLFTRFKDTLTGHDRPLLHPKLSQNFDFEGELAVVIGRPGKHIAVEDALDHVAGYSCFNDASVRDFQKQSVVAGKNFVGTGAMGPWLVTTDEIDDPSAMTLTTRLNGQIVQQDKTSNMVFSVSYLVSYISSFTKLEPGDIIVTGTPSGIGARRTPPLWMQAGDIVEVEISDIGVLRNAVTNG